jgi:hypothetical protein
MSVANGDENYSKLITLGIWHKPCANTALGDTAISSKRAQQHTEKGGDKPTGSY